MKNVFHYTDTKGLCGIISTKSLWLTESSYLNDPDEIEIGKGQIHIEVLQRLLDDYKQNHDESRFEYKILDNIADKLNANKGHGSSYIFICSFCSNGGLLSQWKGYANYGEGFSIGFDLNQLRKCKGYSVSRVIYNENEKHKIFENILHKYFTSRTIYNEKGIDEYCERIFSDLVFVSYFFKSPFFREEKEYRIIKKMNDEDVKRIKLRPGRIGIIPYIELDFVETKIEIKEIFIGPKLDYYRNIKSLLIEIELSKIKRSTNNLQ